MAVDAFFAGAVLATVALAVFFAVVLAGAALVAAVLAGVVRFAVVAVFLAGTPALVAAPADARAAAGEVLGSLRGSATMFLKEVPGRKRGTVVFLIRTVSPVRGLRPVRASRATFWKVPKPVMATLPPLATSRMMTSSTASRASVADFLPPSLDSIALTSSALFIDSSTYSGRLAWCAAMLARTEIRQFRR